MIASFLGREPEPNASGTNAGITQAILLLVALLGYFSLLIIESIKERRKEYEFKRQQMKEQQEIAEAEEKEKKKDLKPLLFQPAGRSEINLTVPAWLNHDQSASVDQSASADQSESVYEAAGGAREDGKVKADGSGSYSTKASSQAPLSGSDISSSEVFMPSPQKGDGLTMKALDMKDVKRKILVRRYQYLSSEPPDNLQISGSKFDAGAERLAPVFNSAQGNGNMEEYGGTAAAHPVGPRSSPAALADPATASGSSLLSQMDPVTVRRLFLPRPGIRRQVSGVLVPASGGGYLHKPRVSVVPEEDEKRASVLVVPSPRYCPKVVHDETLTQIMLRSSPSFTTKRARTPGMSSPKSPTRKSSKSRVLSGRGILGGEAPRSETTRSEATRSEGGGMTSVRSSARVLRSSVLQSSKEEFESQSSRFGEDGFVPCPDPGGSRYASGGSRRTSGGSRHASYGSRYDLGSRRITNERRPSECNTGLYSRTNAVPRIPILFESDAASRQDSASDSSDDDGLVLNMPGGVPRLWRLDEPLDNTHELPVMTFTSIFKETEEDFIDLV